MRIALINMPSALAVCPSTALGALSAAIKTSSHLCDEVYANVEYAAFIGFERYHQIFNEYDLLAGNFLFAAQANEKPICKDDYYSALYQRQGLERDFLPLLISLLDEVIGSSAPFLEQLLLYRDWSQYGAFGFSSTFQQQSATIAFAKMLKAKYPNIPIVCGGANFHGEMGIEWLRNVSAFDYVCVGEGENTLISLLDSLEGGISLANVPNLAYRHNHCIATTAKSRYQFNRLLTPEYDAFFETATRTQIREHFLWEYHRLPIETSRGCWWGAKQHCVFCGLNGSDMEYESAADQDTVTHIARTVSRYNVRHIQFVDNIMPRTYAANVFPVLADRGYDLTAFYEIKSNLSIDELRSLRMGGIVQLQPGIESLNKKLLRTIKKGVTGLQNIYFLKWCRYFGIEVSWNLLWGIPGETSADYDQQTEMFRKIVHLDPPRSVPEIRIQRFSPMQAKPEQFGVTGLRPAKTFAALFPDFEQSHDKLTYFFDIDGHVGISLEKAAEVFDVVEQWRELFRKGASLRYARLPGRKIEIEDRRWPETKQTDVFAFPASIVYELCSLSIMSPAKLAEQVESEFDIVIPPTGLKKLLDQFCERGLMLEEDGLYLAIGVPVTSYLRSGSSSDHMAKLKASYSSRTL